MALQLASPVGHFENGCQLAYTSLPDVLLMYAAENYLNNGATEAAKAAYEQVRLRFAEMPLV